MSLRAQCIPTQPRLDKMLVRADQQGGRGEVLIPGAEEQFHLSGRTRTDVAPLAHNAAGKSRSVARCHGGQCCRLDGGAVAGTGPASRGPDR